MRTLLALVHELDAILQELARGVDELLDLVGHVEGLKRRWWDNGEVEGGWTVEQMDVEDGGGTDEGCTHKSSQLKACASVKLSSISMVRCHAGRIKNGPVLGRDAARSPEPINCIVGLLEPELELGKERVSQLLPKCWSPSPPKPTVADSGGRNPGTNMEQHNHNNACDMPPYLCALRVVS